MSKKENEIRIETEIAQNLAKYWYEKAKGKAFYLNAKRQPLIKALYLDDLASILEQVPEPEKQPEGHNFYRQQIGEWQEPLCDICKNQMHEGNCPTCYLNEPEKQPEVKGVDGYVAWHPVEGTAYTTMSRARSFCEDRLLKSYFNFDSGSDVFAKADAYYAARDIELARASNDGWKIRPVRLQFLDEQPDITAAELVDKLREFKTLNVPNLGSSKYLNYADGVEGILSYAVSLLLQKRKV